MYKNRFDVLSAWTCYVRPAIYFFQRPNRGQNSHYMKLINETNVQSAYLFKETAADITELAGCCFFRATKWEQHAEEGDSQSKQNKHKSAQGPLPRP